MNEKNTVASFQVSTRGYDSFEKKAKNDYHSVTVLGKAAERAAKLEKGTPVEIDGQLATDSWEKDGEKKYKTYVKTFGWSYAPKNFAESVGESTDVPF